MVMLHTLIRSPGVERAAPCPPSLCLPPPDSAYADAQLGGEDTVALRALAPTFAAPGSRASLRITPASSAICALIRPRSLRSSEDGIITPPPPASPALFARRYPTKSSVSHTCPSA